MSSRGIALWLFLFSFIAALLLCLQNQSAKLEAACRKIAALEDRLGAAEQGVGTLRKGVASVESRATSLARMVSNDLPPVRGAVAELSDERARILDQIVDMKELVAPDVARLQEDVLHPSVQISGPKGVGGGVIIHSRETAEDSETYIVSAFHVIEDTVHTEGGREMRDLVEVRFYKRDGKPDQTLKGQLMLYDRKQDVALIRVSGTGRLTNVAKLAGRQTLAGVRVFTPILAIGCPLGHDPLPSTGQITTLNKEVNGKKFWMMSAPTIFGNSGGGIFHRKTHELLGISAMICTYNKGGETPVPHLGIMVSLEEIYGWLDAEHYAFLYDPSVTPEDCERARAAAATTPRPEPAAPPLSAAKTRAEW